MLKTIDFEKTPVVEAVNDILVDASHMGASDIHFDPLEEQMKVRIRVDGLLRDYTFVPNTVKKNLITRIKIISGMNITESRLPQDGAIKTTLRDVNLDLRVSSIPTIQGEKIVIRLLDYSMSNSGLENLGFSDTNLKRVIQMINEQNGIILVTGATGSGKSTTVYSILNKLNKEETNIITVEDPIEMNIAGINQIQTNSEIGLDFATALRSILRQDPNIIMVGEIRDTETAKIAVRASITGHLVLSTIHTNDSLNTIERLLDMDVERYLLSSALTGIISQKLARRLCPHCRQKRETTQYEKNIFRKVLGHEVNEIYSAVGCENCNNGYSGRIAIHEVLVINQIIKDAISENIRKEKLRELVYNTDVITLLQDGLEKVETGQTTFEELLKIIELEEDEKLAEASNLKDAIDYSEIANEFAQEQEQVQEQVQEKQENIQNNIQQNIPENTNQNITQNIENSTQQTNQIPNNFYYTETNTQPQNNEYKPVYQSLENINTDPFGFDTNISNNFNTTTDFSKNQTTNNNDIFTTDINTTPQVETNIQEQNIEQPEQKQNMGINDLVNNIQNKKIETQQETKEQQKNEQPKEKKKSSNINDLLKNLKKN